MTRRCGRSVLVGGIIAASVALLLGCLGPIERPVADFTWCPEGSEGRLDYWFRSTSTTVDGATMERLVWEFDDESPPRDGAAEIVHRFDVEGEYRVTLTVTDSRGISGTMTKAVPVSMAAFVHSTWQLTLGYPPTVSGIVENRCSERLDEVVIRAKFYDVDGLRLTDGTFVVRDLDPGEEAVFAVRASEFKPRIFCATVEVGSFVAECAPTWGPVPLDLRRE